MRTDRRDWAAKNWTLGGAGLALVASGWLAGCGDRDVAAVDPGKEIQSTTEVPIALERKIDLVFVIDDSNSMESNQESLVANFPRFMRVLEDSAFGLPSVHIGVLSTDMGAGAGLDERCDARGHDGRFIMGPQDAGCPGIDGPWIEDVVDNRTGERVRNYDGELADRFSCMASLGTGGCGFEQPLASLVRALENPDNEGFFRDDAKLGVVIVTDEDDCSVRDDALFGPPETLDGELGPLDSFRCADFGVICDSVGCDDYPGDLRCEGPRENCVPWDESPHMDPPSHFADRLAELKGDRDDVIVATISGDAEPFSVIHEQEDGTTYARLAPSCETADGLADPAVRLRAFLEAFPAAQREETSICEGDLSGPLEQVAIRIGDPIVPCVRGQLRDVEPGQPGIQPECSVVEVRSPGTTDEDAVILPACDGAEGQVPCWRMEESELCTGTATGLALEIARGDLEAPARADIRARCVVDG